MTRPDEDSDDEIDSFERIVDVRAALLNVLESVRTATPIDSTTLRLEVARHQARSRDCVRTDKDDKERAL
jgi:hypothetical protein